MISISQQPPRIIKIIFPLLIPELPLISRSCFPLGIPALGKQRLSINFRSHASLLSRIDPFIPLSRDHLRTRIPALEKTFFSKFDSDAAKAFNYVEIPCTTSYSDSQIESQLALPLPFLLGMPASNFALDSKSFQIT